MLDVVIKISADQPITINVSTGVGGLNELVAVDPGIRPRPTTGSLIERMKKGDVPTRSGFWTEFRKSLIWEKPLGAKVLAVLEDERKSFFRDQSEEAKLQILSYLEAGQKLLFAQSAHVSLRSRHACEGTVSEQAIDRARERFEQESDRFGASREKLGRTLGPEGLRRISQELDVSYHSSGHYELRETELH